MFFFPPLPFSHNPSTLLKSSNPLYSTALHCAAPVFLCVDKSLRVHASLIGLTGEDVDGLLLSGTRPLSTPHGTALCAAALWLALSKRASKVCRRPCSL